MSVCNIAAGVEFAKKRALALQTPEVSEETI